MGTGKSLAGRKPSMTASLCQCLLINGENDRKVQVPSTISLPVGLHVVCCNGW